VSSMSRESSKDTLDTVKEIHKLLDSIELKQVLRESVRARKRDRDHLIMIKNRFILG